MTDDERFMARGIELARKGEGRAQPNPMVGAVVVKNGRIVAEGWHRRFGAPHAEAEALRKAGGKARGGTLYVSLEPCSHWGKTPPCTEAVVAAGVTRVVTAMTDPFSSVSGRGIRFLRRRGIEVKTGVGREAAMELNRGYIKRVKSGLPYVTMKWGMSLDGKIATRTGESRWITGEKARRWVHRQRGVHDAILTGIGTVLADDPELTCRVKSLRRRTAVRVVVDSRGRLPLDSKLVKSANRGPVLVAVTKNAPASRLRKLEKKGCEILVLPPRRGRVPLRRLMEHLAFQGMTYVWMEAGGELAEAALRDRLVDRVVALAAPLLIGGKGAPGPLGGEGAGQLREGIRLGPLSVEKMGSDVRIEADVIRP